MNFKAFLMLSLLHNPFTHSPAWTLTPAWLIFILLLQSVCASFANWKNYGFQGQLLSLNHLPSLESRVETIHVFGIANRVTASNLLNSSPRTPFSLRIPYHYSCVIGMNIFWSQSLAIDVNKVIISRMNLNAFSHTQPGGIPSKTTQPDLY